MKFKIKSEATDVASPRSASRKLNGNKAQEKATQQMELLVKKLTDALGEDVQLEVEPNISISDLFKDKKKLN
tara:strand:- start:845 stop:1060 length:216 start_codon:yes stop_codon:yes gene_type:complete